MKISEIALRFKTSVYVLLIFIVVVGVVAYRSLPLEAQPEVKIPIIMVQTIYPGVAPADMEKLVTNPLERELKDLKDVKKMTSASSESVSLISVEFQSGVDLDNAYQRMRDKVDKAKPDLPTDAEDPVLIEINLSEFPMMLISVSGSYGLDRLKQVAEGLEERIEAVPGVLGVDLTGGLDREIQIYLDPKRMEHHRIGVGQVLSRIREEHVTVPAGSIDLGRSKYSVRVPAEYRDVSRMEEIVLKAPGGHSVKLKEIGRVVDGFKERETISRINGKDGITLRVKKRAGENIVRIADEIRDLLAKEKPGLPAGTTLTIRQDNSEFVRAQVGDLENNIITGLILVLGVLFFALGLRNAAFVAISIPLSMLISFAVLQALGITLNIVVLFSLILALGMLVDNSIVVVENIYRHVAEGADRRRAALEATREVAWPIIASTATTVVAFSPLLFWPGIMGEFMQYLPITVVVCLTSSLFVALVINPVLAADHLRVKPGAARIDSVEDAGRIKRAYRRVLEWSMDHPKTVLGGSVAFLAATIALYAGLGAGVELFPRTTPERAQVAVKAPQGTVIDQTDGIMRQVERIAGEEDNTKDTVANVGLPAGALPVGNMGGASNEAVADLEFKDRHERSHSTWDTVESIRRQLKGVAGAELRVEVEKGGPPTGAPVSVEISGPDYRVLSRYAQQARRLIATVPGVVDLKDDFDGGKPELRVEVDREKAMQRKVNTSSIAQAIRAAVNGEKASVLREGDDEFDITVRYDRPYRDSIEDVLDIKITGKDDVQVPLRDVARVYSTAGLGSIKHIDQKRTVLISADVTGRSSAEVMAEVKKLLSAKLELPAGYGVYYSGEDEAQQEATAFLERAFLIGLMAMLMILITQFNSVMRPAIILSSVVMSLNGVLLGLLVTGNKFGVIMTGMGVISLAGVVVNNAIVLIDYANQLMQKQGLSIRDALVRAGMVRFRPVLLTAVTTVLGLLPMALGVGIDFRTMSIDTGAQSMEWWGPMAQAVSFGLVFATALTLVMVPVMYLAQERSKDWALEKIRGLRHALSRRPRRAE